MRLVALAAMVLVCASAGAAEVPVPPRLQAALAKIEARFVPDKAAPGQTVELELTLTPKPDWHTYPTRQADKRAGSQVVELMPTNGPAAVVLVGAAQDPPGAVVEEDITLDGAKVASYTGPVTYKHPAVVSPSAKPGDAKVNIDGFKPLICRGGAGGTCLSTRVKFELPITIDGQIQAVERQYLGELEQRLKADVAPAPARPVPQLEQAAPVVAQVPLVNVDGDTYARQMQELAGRIEKGQSDSQKPADLGTLLLTAAFFGAITLVTPCVFPMIPITVSFFLHQPTAEQGKRASPLLLAGVYSLTIILVLGGAAFGLINFFYNLSTQGWMNYLLGAVFVFFSLALFGVFELQLPGFIANRFAKGEEQGGVVGTIFMALTFSVISFSCVAPFLGSFSALVGSGKYGLPSLILAALTFSSVFALPFFLLALFPALLQTLPKSGGWLNRVKVTMGFLELAAALVFFRTGELLSTQAPQLFTFDLVLAGWVVLSTLCGLYLLGQFRLPHDAKAETVGVASLFFAAAFLGLAVYLLPGLFGTAEKKYRPNGVVYAWIESFLLPDGHDDLPWSGDLKAAIDDALRQAKVDKMVPQYVFIDFTGVNCKNCRLNEQNVFGRPKVRELFAKYRLVQLWTDQVPLRFYSPDQAAAIGSNLDRQKRDAEVNQQFQEKAVGTIALPTYVVLRVWAEGTITIVRPPIEGLIQSAADFERYLAGPSGG